MALKIVKLAITPKQTISTSPTVARYFHEVPETITEVTTHKINASDFLNDQGEIAQSLPVLNLNNSYFNVYINGILFLDES